MATWTLGEDGLWRDENNNVADEAKAEALVTRALDGNRRSTGENIKGGLGRGLVSAPAMIAGAATSAPQINPDLMRDAELFGGEPIPKNPSGYDATFNAARNAGIPMDYDEGSLPGLLADFTAGSLAMGGPGRIATAKGLISKGSGPVKAYLGQFGREAGQAAAAAGSTAAMQSVSKDVDNPLAKIGLGLAAPMLPNLALLGMTGAVRGFGRGIDGDGLAEGAAKFRAATGAEPMAQQVAQNDRMWLASRGMEMTGVGALPLSQKMEAQTAQFAAKTADIAGGVEKSAAEGGEAITKGIFGPTGYIKTEDARIGNLYDELFTGISPEFRMPLVETKRRLNKFIERYKDDPEFKPILEDPLFTNLAKALDENQAARGGPTVGTVRALRTDLGRLLNNRSVAPSDNAIGEIRHIYGGLSDDLKTIAQALDGGTPGAFSKRAAAADSAWTTYQDKLDTHLRKLEGMDVNDLYTKVRYGSADQATTVLGSLPKAEREVFTEVFINRLGLTKRKEGNAEFDIYSPNTFLNNWGDLSPRVQSALIPNTTQRAQLNDMAKAFRGATRNNKVVFNSSGTTGSGQLSTMIIGALSGVATAVGGAAIGNPAMALTGAGLTASIGTVMAMSHWAATKLADPKFVSWLAKANTIPAVAVPGHIARLQAIDFGSEADNAMRDQAAAALMQRFNQQPPAP
jgi:hypothetical protein